MPHSLTSHTPRVSSAVVTFLHFFVRLVPGTGGGCKTSHFPSDIATQSADRQARQNERMAEIHKVLAAGAKRLVEADALARGELIALQHKVQAEQVLIDEQRDALEVERRIVARQRRIDSALPAIVRSCAMVALAVAMVGFCWSLLFGLRTHDDTESVLGELLITQLTTDQPSILPLVLPRL